MIMIRYLFVGLCIGSVLVTGLLIFAGKSGPQLGGVTKALKQVSFSADTFAKGKYQKYIEKTLNAAAADI